MGRGGWAAGGQEGARKEAEFPRWTPAAGCHHCCPTTLAADTGTELYLIWRRNPHPHPQARGHTSLTQHGQSLYRKYFTSYSNKPTKLWIKIWGLQKKKKKKKGEDMPDTLCFSVVVPQGLAAESQLAREGSGWKQGAKSAAEPRAPGAGNGGGKASRPAWRAQQRSCGTEGGERHSGRSMAAVARAHSPALTPAPP